jgi:hypothetical protein
MDCPKCYRDMTHLHDSLMRTHTKETRKRYYICVCGMRLRIEERRYPKGIFKFKKMVVE